MADLVYPIDADAINITGEVDFPLLDDIEFNRTKCYEPVSFQRFQYTVDDLLLAASTASTVFNIMVIFCALKLLKRSGDTMHMFIINMTLGDLLLTVFCHPNEFLTRKHVFLRHIHLCTVIHFCNWLGLAISGLSLTMLNVDKLIYFRWPLRYDQTMSKRRAAILCVLIWAISLGFVSYVWMFNIAYVTADCTINLTQGKHYYYHIFMILFCVLPVSSSLLVSIYLFRLTRQKRAAPVAVGAQDIPTFKIKVRFFTLFMAKSKMFSKMQMKSLMFIFATTVWTSFSLLPYRIFNICRIYLIEWDMLPCHQRTVMNWLAWVLLYLLTLNPIVNPLITAIIYAPYRITLKKLFINIPIGNRLPYNSYRGDTTDSSFLSVRRKNRNSASIDHEMSLLQRNTMTNALRTSLNSYDANTIPEETNMETGSAPGGSTGQLKIHAPERPKSSTFPSSGGGDGESHM
uniref:G_PROTEIN_RECEP_F1_2 domain-containing protein n=1 Tax=Panagrellus redivivus TaxID=6233 RepID=A0A7E4ZVN1_PANRE